MNAERNTASKGLSVRARNGVLNALGRYRSERCYKLLEAVEAKAALAANEIANIGEAALRELPNVGNGTIREIKDWLAKHGQELSP
jgi:pantothenate synthetase